MGAEMTALPLNGVVALVDRLSAGRGSMVAASIRPSTARGAGRSGHRLAVLAFTATALLSLAACGGGGSGGPSPSSASVLMRSDLHRGDTVGLASGLRLILPSGVSGSMVRNWPGGPTEDVALTDERGRMLALIESLSTKDVESLGIRGYDLNVIARSGDGSVEVRWRANKALRVSNVVVITRLPGRLIGVVDSGPRRGRGAASSAAGAYRQALELWHQLSVTGVELPEFVPGES